MTSTCYIYADDEMIATRNRRGVQKATALHIIR